MLKSVLIVGFGGAIGAMLRYIITLNWKATNFPVTTLTINIAGSFIIGIVFALSAKTTLISTDLKLFLATGICGGFTTFSTFSAENMQLLKTGNYSTAFLYIIASVCFCILATFIGYKIINN